MCRSARPSPGSCTATTRSSSRSKIRMLEKLGATAVCVMNVSGADPQGTIRTYGEHVLPALRAD